MLLLPRLKFGSKSSPLGDSASDCRLPLSESAAASLAEALVLGYSGDLQHRVAQIISCEPGLTLWCLCELPSVGISAPVSFIDLARELIEHGPTALKWTECDLRSVAVSPQQLRRWQGLYEASLERMEIGRWTNSAADALADAGSLVDLLDNAGDWLSSCLTEESTCCVAELPGWLAPAMTERRAMVSARCESLDESDCRAARRHAALARERWTHPGPLDAALLPRLTTILGRLAALEGDFERQVEEAKLEAMAEFAAGAGHEINNPLAVISGRAQLLVRDEVDPERRRDLALIHSQAMRVYEMIADMMLAARPPQPELQEIELGSLLEKLLNDLQPRAQLRNITLRFCPPTNSIWVQADPTQLTVAVRALCDNAFEAIGDQGQVEVTCSHSDDDKSVEIAVHDSGPGIAPEVRQHLFDPYYSGRQAGRGLGVGLAKCRAIVERHGGEIRVMSEPEHGSTFVIKLPLLSAMTERGRDRET